MYSCQHQVLKLSFVSLWVFLFVFNYFDRQKNNVPLSLICIKNVSSPVEHFFAVFVCKIGLSQVCGKAS